jgi:hypothetical protein
MTSTMPSHWPTANLKRLALAAVACCFVSATARGGTLVQSTYYPYNHLSLGGSRMDISGSLGQPYGTTVIPYSAQPDQSGQGIDGLTAHFNGILYAEVGPLGTSLLPYNSISSSGNPPSHLGSYKPGDINGTPTTGSPIPGYSTTPIAEPGDFGFQVGTSVYGRMWELTIGPTSAYYNAPMPQVGPQSYAEATQIWGMLDGYQDLLTPRGAVHTSLSGAIGGNPFPLVLTGTLDLRGPNPIYTPGPGVATWDGVALTINVQSTVISVIDAGDQNNPLDDIIDYRVTSGQMQFFPIPEPHTLSLALIAFVLSAIAHSWRKRAQRLARSSAAV